MPQAASFSERHRRLTHYRRDSFILPRAVERWGLRQDLAADTRRADCRRQPKAVKRLPGRRHAGRLEAGVPMGRLPVKTSHEFTPRWETFTTRLRHVALLCHAGADARRHNAPCPLPDARRFAASFRVFTHDISLNDS